jgi:hypothetical protein
VGPKADVDATEKRKFSTQMMLEYYINDNGSGFLSHPYIDSIVVAHSGVVVMPSACHTSLDNLFMQF